ncbi:MAG: glycosyltransferase [Planctomycetota bacterium]|nr:MAG: glycosyltransferase [Planctomycetota bacterium]
MLAWILHPHDPCVDYASGVGTMINTFIAHAPADLEVRLAGITVEPERRPVGRWSEVEVGGRRIRQLPLLAAHPSIRSRIPVSLRYTLRLRRFLRRTDLEGGSLLFHRLEPAWPALRRPEQKLMFLHYHPEDQILGSGTEVTWRRFPGLYFRLERRILPRVDRLWSERSDAIEWWLQRHPALAGKAEFLPTWADDTVFHPLPEEERAELRRRLCTAAGLDPALPLAFFAGRFEAQKDPMLLLRAWRALPASAARAQLVLAGEGSFGDEMRAFVAAEGLADRVHFAGALGQREVARWLNAADAFVMSSAFEGMPLAMIEALACGTPVASTRIGEAPRLVRRPEQGRLVAERDPAALAGAIAEVLAAPRDRAACLEAARPFTPRAVLEPVYRAIRERAAGADR